MAVAITRVKNWTTNETIKTSDLNAEFNNIINNLKPANLDNHSSTVSQMQETFDPGSVGSENQPQTLADEVKSLRYMMDLVIGGAQWYTSPSKSLTDLDALVVSSLSKNRVVSGLVDANNYPQYMTFSTLDLSVEGDVTDLVYVVDDVTQTLTTDESATLSAGPSANNTGTYNGQTLLENSKYVGEYSGVGIVLSGAGAEISSRVGQLQGFQTTNGGDTEYFIGRIYDAGSHYEIRECFRGFLFDGSGVAQRVELAAAQVITMLELKYIFLQDDGDILNTDNEPIVSGTQPASPSSGDFWFDTSVEIWKQYDGSSFVDSDSTFVGYAAADNEIRAVRAPEFAKDYSEVNDVKLQISSVSSVANSKIGGKLNINGSTIDLHFESLTWDMATDLDSGITEAADVRYYFYVNDTFSPVVSDIRPYDRYKDLKGYYHPFKPWRCLGYVENDSGLDFQPNLKAAISFGGSSGVGENSISVNKLRKYNFTDNVAELNNIGIIPATFTINNASGSDTNGNDVELVTSGRPVMMMYCSSLDPVNLAAITQSRATLTVAAGNSVDVEIIFERRPEDSSTYLPVANFSLVKENTDGANTLNDESMLSLKSLDFAPNGKYVYRVRIAKNTVAGADIVDLNGNFIVMEL